MSQIATDHFSLDTSNMVSDICKPLTKILNVNLFIYQRSIINEKVMRVETNAYLCNYPEVLKFILSLAPKNREPAKYDYSKIRKYILLDSTQPGFTTMLRDKFKINGLMSRDERIGTNEWEHLIIGTASNNTAVVNSYINNIGVLDKFLSYFRSKAAKTINKACNNNFISGRPIKKCNFSNSHNVLYSSQQKFSLIPEPKYYYVTGQKENRIIVPQAEMRYLSMISQGRSAKEIASILNVSPRTVESNLRNAKLRFGCETRGRLLNIIEEWKKSNAWTL